MNANHSRSTVASLLAVALLVAAAGCGSTGSLKGPAGEEKVDLSAYTRVVVLDLAYKPVEADPPERRADQEKAAAAGASNFSDALVKELDTRHAFTSVARVGAIGADAGTLVIRGNITRWAEGSSAARFWVGMGAGSSYLDAVVELHQGLSGKLLGTIAIDKHSWVLGGGLASGQTPGTFAKEVATDVADQLIEAKGTSAKK